MTGLAPTCLQLCKMETQVPAAISSRVARPTLESGAVPHSCTTSELPLATAEKAGCRAKSTREMNWGTAAWSGKAWAMLANGR